jgi:hypothetical protein
LAPRGGVAAGEGGGGCDPVRRSLTGKAQPYRTAGAVGAGGCDAKLAGVAEFLTASQPHRMADGVAAGEGAGLWSGKAPKV